MRKILDAGDGVQTTVALQDGNLITGTVQDCTPIVEMTKAMHNEGRVGSADMRLAASIPRVLVEAYCNDAGVTFAELMQSAEHKKRLLNDPALSHFRVWAGRV